MQHECPLESIEHALAFASKDWSLDQRDAWIYGIALGWDGAALKELTEKHGWSPETVARLRRLRAAWNKLKEAA